MQPDPGGASDDSKLTGFGYFSPSDKVSDWITSRLAEGPYRHCRMGFDNSALVLSLRWHCVSIP
jgi:hypothetical protein